MADASRDDGELGRRAFLRRSAAVTAVGLAGALARPERTRATDAKSPEPRLRQWVMVIDLRRCDGCAGLALPPQCTQFCNWSRFVPEAQQWLEVYAKEIVEDLPDSGVNYLPAPCMQCQNAPCVNVCPVGATFHTPEGVVLIDQERCIGCRFCMAACPYDRRFFNWGEPVQPPPTTSRPRRPRSRARS